MGCVGSRFLGQHNCDGRSRTAAGASSDNMSRESHGVSSLTESHPLASAPGPRSSAVPSHAPTPATATAPSNTVISPVPPACSSPQQPTMAMASSPDQQHPPKTIIILPDEMKEAISTSLEARDKLQARLATKEFRSSFAKSIKRLYARNASLPFNAIEAFPEATEVVLSFDYSLTQAELDARLQLFRLPKGMEYLSVMSQARWPRGRDATAIRRYHQTRMDAFFMHTLPSFPCHKTLKTVHVSDIGSKGAQYLLKSLPNLTDVDLDVCYNPCEEDITIDTFPLKMERFKIKTHTAKVDLANLARCSKLRSLWLFELYEPRITNICQGLAGCTDLRRLDAWGVQEFDSDSAAAALPGVLQQMQQMQHFHGPTRISTSSALWRAFSKHPALSHVETHWLYVDSIDMPAGSITHLTASAIRTDDLPACLPEDVPLSGLLTTLLPGLQEVRSPCGFIRDSWYEQRDKSVSVLHEHKQVRVVVVGGVDTSMVWRPRTGIPNLQVYEVGWAISEPCLDVRLAELSACSELRQVQLGTGALLRTGGYQGELVTAGGLQQLVDGACKQSLRCVRLSAHEGEVGRSGQGAAPVGAVALLRDGLPQLSELELDVQLPRVEGSTVYSNHQELCRKRVWPLDEGHEARMLAVMQGMFDTLQQELLARELQLAGAASDRSRYWEHGFITLTGTLSGCAVRLRVWDAYKRV